MAHRRQSIDLASDVTLERIFCALGAGQSYFKVGQTFNFHPEVIKRRWMRLTSEERASYVAKASERSLVVAETLPSTDREWMEKVEVALCSALTELSARLRGESAKTINDRDLISAVKMLWDMKNAESSDSAAKIAIQSNVKNITNIFERSIEEHIKK